VKDINNALIGTSAASQAVREEVANAARCDAKVLVTGESGVGKDVASRLIHSHSARAQQPFIAINCVGIPESLLESELFGHVRGSFTGALRDRSGLFERANGGTVFLDEVGEMGGRMQALLLRFLETGEIQRVGAERAEQRLNVRVIAATNRNPLSEVAAGTFREDLYYRLNVMEITIPPLRERREDIPLLLEHFLRLYSTHYQLPMPAVSREAMDCLTAYKWPGNVRQLRNVVERLVVRRCGPTIDVHDLPALGGATPRLIEFPVREAKPSHAPAAEPGAPGVVEAMFDRMVKHGESFWSAVYEPFMQRDVTREHLRALISRGLRDTAGSYKILVGLFNMAPSDYKRFLNFLRKQDCRVPFARFRTAPSGAARMPEHVPVARSANAGARP
jgi:transcriptional regulator with PAS, ATPase and Fis domain